MQNSAFGHCAKYKFVPENISQNYTLFLNSKNDVYLFLVVQNPELPKSNETHYLKIKKGVRLTDQILLCCRY